jgi:hypothetical protein
MESQHHVVWPWRTAGLNGEAILPVGRRLRRRPQHRAPVAAVCRRVGLPAARPEVALRHHRSSPRACFVSRCRSEEGAWCRLASRVGPFVAAVLRGVPPLAARRPPSAAVGMTYKTRPSCLQNGPGAARATGSGPRGAHCRSAVADCEAKSMVRTAAIALPLLWRVRSQGVMLAVVSGWHMS